MAFGFEFEMLIPVFSMEGNKTALPACRQVPPARGGPKLIRSPEIGTANDGSFVASVERQARLDQHKPASWDPDESMTCLEIATSAMDETALTREEVEQAFAGIATWADHLYQSTIGGRQLIDGFLTATMPGANFAGPSDGRENDRFISASAFMQETYGLRLDRVTQEFTSRANAVPEALRPTIDWYNHLRFSGMTAPGALTSNAFDLFGDPGGPRAAAELRGLLALIRYYLAMRKQNANKSGLGKNKVGVFYYKTQLSTVCGLLGQKYPAIAAFLSQEANRAAVCDALGAGNNRAWTMDVLAGVSDSFFLETMNAYSEELFAPALGPQDNQSVGVVVENRQFRVTYAPKNAQAIDSTESFPPDKWPSIATRLYDRLQAMHNG